MSVTLEHALVHPTRHIAQYAQRVVIQYLVHFLAAPVGPVGQQDGENVGEPGARARLQFVLPRFHIDLVIMQCMQVRVDTVIR